MGQGNGARVGEAFATIPTDDAAPLVDDVGGVP
jgi:hypothetical protein